MLSTGLTNVNETCEAPTRNPEMQTCKSLKPILDGQNLATQGSLYYPHVPVASSLHIYVYIYIYIYDIWNQGSIVTWYIGLPGSLVPNDWELEDEGYLPKQWIILGKSLKMTVHVYPFIIWFPYGYFHFVSSSISVLELSQLVQDKQNNIGILWNYPKPKMPVTTRIIPFLVGNPYKYKPSFETVTGWGVDQMYTFMVLFILAAIKSLQFYRGQQKTSKNMKYQNLHQTHFSVICN